MTRPAPLRIFCVTAAEAPIVAVFNNVATNWSHVGQWDLARLRYEPGAWLRGHIFFNRANSLLTGGFSHLFRAETE